MLSYMEIQTTRSPAITTCTSTHYWINMVGRQKIPTHRNKCSASPKNDSHSSRKQHPPTAAATDPANPPPLELTHGKRKQTGHPPTAHLPALQNPIATPPTTLSKTDNGHPLPDRNDLMNPTSSPRKHLDETTRARQTRVPTKSTLRRCGQNESHPAHRPEKVGLPHIEARKAVGVPRTNTSRNGRRRLDPPHGEPQRGMHRTQLCEKQVRILLTFK